MCVPYFREYRSPDGVISSVDMVTVDGKFYGRSEDVSERFFWLVKDCLINYTDWISYKLGSFRYQYSVKCGNGCSFWFGLGFNSPSDGYVVTCNRWRIEFNPNKVMTDFIFLKIYTSLLRLSRRYELKRFDLAVDYPVARSCCFLVKDGRTYSEYTNSCEDKTQNLGQRSKHGFVKLYNKQIESHLPIPFTRLELTIDNKQKTYSDIEKIFPTVYVIESLQLQFDDLKLNDTERFILWACLENPNSVKMLGRKMQKKIESILAEYSRTLKIDYKGYKYILGLLEFFVKVDFLFELILSADVIPGLNGSFNPAEDIPVPEDFYIASDFIDCLPEECLHWGPVAKYIDGDNGGGSIG